MEYLIIGILIILLIYFGFFNNNNKNSSGDIEKIRMLWGHPKSKNQFDFIKIGKYADLVKEKYHRLSDQTIQDIDFHKLFTYIDRTTSRIGQQYFYKKVLEPNDKLDEDHEKLIQLFSSNKSLREEIQLQLIKLDNDNSYHITSLFRNSFLEKPKWLNLLAFDLFIIVALIILSFQYQILLIILIIPFSINMVIHSWNKNNTFHYAWSVPQLNIMIDVCRELLQRDKMIYNKSVEDGVLHMKSFQQNVKFIQFNGDGIQVNIGQYAVDLLKAFFLIEVFMIFKVIRELKDKQSAIRILYEYIGNIDSSISIASLRAGKLKTCKPVFSEPKKEMIVKNMYHPLIKNSVKNSLTIRKKSVLITGSNMSGKSTFLRTMTINSILAQTIHTCFADEFISPILKQFTSIRINDDVFEGKSYYFQEVNVMASLVSEAEQTSNNLFVLDEVFKGTNTIERISSAKAVLSYLNRTENIVIVSTHDIELADMLCHEYELYHFTEIIESGKICFDYTIRSGQLKTRNAIRILEMACFPNEITEEAYKISSTFGSLKHLK